MSYVRVCDLCGKPLLSDCKEYKIKERWFSWHESGWMTIEAHGECIKKLLNALDDKQEEAKR